MPDYPGLLRLDGKRFVVLGAGQESDGRRRTRRPWARLAVVDVDLDLASDIAAEVDGIGLSGDATDRAHVELLFADATAKLGGIDGVVDIIGMARYATIAEMTDEEWDWHFDIVLRHAFLAMQYGGRAMAASGGGAMVFVASVSGITSAPRHSAYGAAKAGLMSMVRTGAVEMGPSGIRINAVAPGVVWTPRVSGMLGDEGRDLNVGNTPLRRVRNRPDIAAAILFLASDLAARHRSDSRVDGGVGAVRTRWEICDGCGPARAVHARLRLVRNRRDSLPPRRPRRPQPAAGRHGCLGAAAGRRAPRTGR